MLIKISPVRIDRQHRAAYTLPEPEIAPFVNAVVHATGREPKTRDGNARGTAS